MIPVDLTRSMLQVEFGELVGISQPAVSGMLSSGILTRGATGHEWLLAYCERLRTEAAGRASPTSEALVRERTALARAQREAQELKNVEWLGQYAPVGLLEDVLATASAAIADGLEGLGRELQLAAPELPDVARDAVLQAIQSAREEWIGSTAHLAPARLDLLEQDGPDDSTQ